MTKADTPATDWRAKLEEAYEMTSLAHTYADDGAFFTCADRLEQAAKLFREGAQLRKDAMGDTSPPPTFEAAAADDDSYPPPCTDPGGHVWPNVEEAERCLCIHCGADGDA